MASAVQYYLNRGRITAGLGIVGKRVTMTTDTAAEVSFGQFEEKIRASIMTGAAELMPYLDRQTNETMEMRRAYRSMLRHPVVKAALLKKVFSVSSLDLSLNAATDTPREKEAAEFALHAYTREIEGGFPQLCETVLIHGLIDGTGVSEPVWNEWPAERGRWKGKRFYRALKAKEYVELEVDQFRNITGVKASFGSERWAPEEFVIWKHMPLFDGPGVSDFRAVYGKLWMLDTVEKLRMIHLEKFTSPYFKGEYTGKDDKATLETEIAKATSRSWVVVPTGTKLDAMQIATRGEAEFQAAIKELKEDVALAIAGAFLDFLAASSAGGEMRGSASVSKSSAELFVWRLVAVMMNVMDRQLTPRLIDHNFIDVDYPSATLGGVNYAEMLQSIQLEEIAQRMGHKPSRKAFIKKYGLQEATAPEDALTPTPAAPPGGGGLPFMFSDRQPCGCAANDTGHSFCGGKGGKPGPCPSGVKAGPKVGKGKPTRAAPAKPATTPAKPPAKPTPKAKAPKPADVKIQAAADKVQKINVKVTAAKAKLEGLKGELKAAKADLAEIKKSIPKEISARTKANKAQAESAAQKLEAYANKWTSAADAEGKKAKNNRPDFSKQPTSQEMEAAVTEMLGKTSPIEVAKSLGYKPKNRAQATQYVREHVLTRVGMARRRYV